MTSITVRKLEAEDAEAASRTVIASITELCVADHRGDAGVINAWTANKTPAHFAEWAGAPNLTSLIAQVGGRCAGVAAARETGTVVLNYVDPCCRFKGVSRALLMALETGLAARGLTEAELESTQTAHRFYLSCGWQDEGAPIERFGMPGYPMRKRLEA